MNRKKFLTHLGTTVAAASLVPNLISCTQNKPKKIRGLKNWAGNYTYKAEEVQFPNSLEELTQILKGISKGKALGTQHCFNDIADTQGMQLSTKNLNTIIELNTAEGFVLVESGIKYGDLGKQLHEKGWGLHNLASLPHISVGGSCATATHGCKGLNCLPHRVISFGRILKATPIYFMQRELAWEPWEL
jgi:alditol oxidase